MNSLRHNMHTRPDANPLHHEISKRFSAAASQYAEHAHVQALSAQALWVWAQQHARAELKQPGAFVDVGCGTGFLTQQLLSHPSAAPVHAIDIAPGMLHILRSQQHQSTALHTHCLDGSLLNANTLAWPQPTWLLSNLCMQWFSNLPQALHNWLGFAQGISVAVLLDGSFAPWKAAHQAANQPCMLRPLPSADVILEGLSTLRQQGQIGQLYYQKIQFTDSHPDGLAFARSLKAIGAHTPATAQHSSQLRRVLTALHRLQGHGNMNYDIGFFHLEP